MQRAAWAAIIAGVVTVTVAARTGAPPQPATAASVGMLDEHPAIQYATRPTRDRVLLLNQAIARGTTSLAFREPSGYLKAVLDALGVAAESQLLVFSKTGVQRAHTDPQNPRAIFFDDSVVVGFIPGARFLELAAHDPEQGVVFYTIDQVAAATPVFTRRTNCLTCHVSASTLEVPGLINRSMHTRDDGQVIPQLGSETVDHRTPLLQRWGGMYVTGTYTVQPYTGRKEHMGNVTTSIADSSGATSTNEAFIRWINSAPESRGYPSAESDIASLMVFDHQARAVNLLTRLNWETRAAADGRPNPNAGAWRELIEEVTDYLLFVGEAPPPARLSPRAGFARQFTAAAPTDRQGRSLRELDLETRLLRYPCSYMIYTSAFDNLPALAKDAVYRQMWNVLSGRDHRQKYAHLSAADRRALIEIVRETKKDLPEVFASPATIR